MKHPCSWSWTALAMLIVCPPLAAQTTSGFEKVEQPKILSSAAPLYRTRSARGAWMARW